MSSSDTSVGFLSFAEDCVLEAAATHRFISLFWLVTYFSKFWSVITNELLMITMGVALHGSWLPEGRALHAPCIQRGIV